MGFKTEIVMEGKSILQTESGPIELDTQVSNYIQRLLKENWELTQENNELKLNSLKMKNPYGIRAFVKNVLLFNEDGFVPLGVMCWFCIVAFIGLGIAILI